MRIHPSEICYKAAQQVDGLLQNPAGTGDVAGIVICNAFGYFILFQAYPSMRKVIKENENRVRK